MSEEDALNGLIASGEGPTVDFKRLEVISNPIKLATLMAAFANTSGGRILVGVNDNGSIEGMRENKKHESHIMNIARDKCEPPIDPKFSVVRKNDGDVYVIKVTRYQKLPHAVKTKEGNVYFIRVGSTVREASPNELALLFESADLQSKKPDLELLLVDQNGKAVKEIQAEPTVVKKIIKKRSAVRSGQDDSYLSQLLQTVTLARGAFGSDLFEEKEPAKDLIAIGIQIANAGGMAARGIRVSLEFPAECKLLEKREAVGGIGRIGSGRPTSGGLFVDEQKTEAHAWIETLGNDLSMKSFDEVYVRFLEIKQQYKIRGRVIQYDFPPKDFEFLVSVSPKLVEVEEVYDDENP